MNEKVLIEITAMPILIKLKTLGQYSDLNRTNIRQINQEICTKTHSLIANEFLFSGMRFSVILLIALFFNMATVVSQENNTTHKTHYIVGVAMNLPPYSLLDKKGLAIGYSVDITNAIAEVMQLDIEVIIAPFGELRLALEEGEIDAMPMYYSDSRKKEVDFTSPYSTVHNAIFVQKDSRAIKSEEELRGKKIIVIDGDIMHDYIIENNITEKLFKVPLETDALQLLASGDYDCALMAQLPGLYWLKQLEISNIVTVGPLMLPSEICYAVKKENIKLYNLLSEGLATLGENGEHSRIHDKWLGVLIPDGISLKIVLKYIAFAVIPILIFLVIAIAWSRILKKQVTQRTLELKESEERFRTIFENSPVLINSFDENGRCLLWNKQCRLTFGWTIDEINAHDKPLSLFYPEPTLFEEVVKSVTSDPSGQFREWNPVTKDGQTLTTNWANFHLPSGQVFSLGHDITKQKIVELELTKHQKNLEKLINERTKELEVKNEELEKFNKLFIGREFRIKELKEKVKKLEGK